MTRTLDSKSTRRQAARLAAGLGLSALFILGTFVVPANAQPHRDDQHRDDRRVVHHDDRDFHGGGYYAPPPVVYGGPVYAPPPVVYGPGVSIDLPGVTIGIQ